ncbi:MAG: alpha/beta fold hydrolase [Nitrospirae bacterium]|nr:alpha/beta fold hydrolase [Nitrospirota bacterium]MBI3351155.1 alpha/beta fold hydrolase [Nitrospirota bacterium]
MNSVKLFLIFIFFLSGCATTAQTVHVALSDRHQPTGGGTDIKYDGLSFENYIKLSRKVIANSRTDLKNKGREEIIDGNSPFELEPPQSCAPGKNKRYRRGVLLSHGLTDSPYFTRQLGQFFQEHCFRVMAILLPGHGTRPGDLLDVTWQEWAQAEAFGTDALASEVDEVYLWGFSTGGALSVSQSLRDPRVKGLFLFSPAIQITSMASLANLHKIYSWALPGAKWIDLMKDEDPFKYESFPYNAAYQIYLLTLEVRSSLDNHKLTIPTFIAASEDDSTVMISGTVDFFDKANNPNNKMILYTTKTGIPSGKIDRVNSFFPDQHILTSAHTAIVLSAASAHYGINGDYAYCSHYFPKEMGKYDRCKNKKEDYLGEISEENLKKGVIRRLMYNPNFDSLESSLSQFIESLP